MKIIWLSEASRSLEAIYDFYSSKSEEVANKIINNIYRAVLLLSQHPFIAAEEQALSEFSGIYRSLVVWRLFKIVYRVDKENQTIIIVTIWDCRRNPEKLRGKIK